MKTRRNKIWLGFFCLLVWLRPGTGDAAGPGPTAGAVATQQPLATEAAIKILRNGGNAFDAAIAAAFTLAVVEPYNSGLGGGGFALLWDAKKKRAFAVDFRETAPRATHSQTFINSNLPPDAAQIGPWAIATPGTPAGLGFIHQKWGKTSWQNLFSDPIAFADQGFDGGTLLHRRVQERADCLSRDYHSAQIFKNFLPEEMASSWLTQPELAASLKLLRDKGVQEFYVGPMAEKIVTGIRNKGGQLSEQDFAQYRVVERTPLSTDFSWGRVWGFPLPSSGGIGVLQGLNILDGIRKKSPALLAKEWPVVVTLVLEKIFSERNQEMGDPDFVKKLLFKFWVQKDSAAKDADEIFKRLSGNTSHLSIIDKDGNAVAMTLTLNLSFGSCLMAGETGILMNSEMDDFTTQPNQANAFGLLQSKANQIEAGKRPLSSMAPTLVTQSEKVSAVLGSPGGPKIISSVLQVLARRFLLEENWETALRGPRVHFQGSPAEVLLELGSPEAWSSLLTQAGFKTQTNSPWGNVQLVAWDENRQQWIALSDPRGQGSGQVIQP